MTDLVVRPRLLPGRNADPRLDAISDVDARLDDLDVSDIVDVCDPVTCPAKFLRWLAFQKSVDVWSEDWPEAIRRAVIIAAPIVHSIKGTPRSLQMALSSIEVDAELIEWWEQLPRAAPYTFKVRAYARSGIYDGPILDPRLIDAIHGFVMANKPASRAYTLTVGGLFPSTLGLAAAATAKTVARVVATPSLDVQAARTLGLAAVATARVVVRRSVIMEAAA